MLRPDFPEIFDYLTRKAVSYSINTNGTLITPEIARLLDPQGDKDDRSLWGDCQGL
jgi:MoaA/NifB/PqqE/SkfB family radical SAM enzyme